MLIQIRKLNARLMLAPVWFLGSFLLAVSVSSSARAEDGDGPIAIPAVPAMLELQDAGAIVPEPQTTSVRISVTGEVVRRERGDSPMPVAQLSYDAIDGLKARIESLPAEGELVDLDAGAPHCAGPGKVEYRIWDGIAFRFIGQDIACHRWRLRYEQGRELIDLIRAFRFLSDGVARRQVILPVPEEAPLLQRVFSVYFSMTPFTGETYVLKDGRMGLRRRDHFEPREGMPSMNREVSFGQLSPVVTARLEVLVNDIPRLRETDLDPSGPRCADIPSTHYRVHQQDGFLLQIGSSRDCHEFRIRHHLVEPLVRFLDALSALGGR